MERWIAKWYQGGSRCTGLERTTEQKNISLAEAQGAFYILGIGLLIATICLLIENGFSKKKTKPATITPRTRKERMVYVNSNIQNQPSHYRIPKPFTEEFIPALTFIPFHGIKLDYTIQDSQVESIKTTKSHSFPSLHLKTFFKRESKDKNCPPENKPAFSNEMVSINGLIPLEGITSVSNRKEAVDRNSHTLNGTLVQNQNIRRQVSHRIGVSSHGNRNKSTKKKYSIANGVNPSSDLANGLKRWHSTIHKTSQQTIANGYHRKDVETGEVN